MYVYVRQSVCVYINNNLKPQKKKKKENEIFNISVCFNKTNYYYHNFKIGLPKDHKFQWKQVLC